MTPIVSTPETRRRDAALMREVDPGRDYNEDPDTCESCCREPDRYVRFRARGGGDTCNLCRPCLIAALAALDAAP